MAADTHTTLETVHCNLCGVADESILFIKDGFRIVKCNSCGLIFVNPRPDKEYLQELYAEDYYKISAQGSIGYRDYEADKQYHSVNFGKLLSVIERYQEKGRLLDVGCALGFFLEEAKRRGWDVYGTELSAYAVNKAKEKGLTVFGGDIIAAGFKKKFFDAVTCLGTLEHLPDPISAIQAIRTILKDDGLFVLSTPNAGGMIGGRRFQYKPKEHLYYFTRTTMKKLLEKQGFKILSIKNEWIKKPGHFIVERLGYYFPGSKYFARGIETAFKRLGILNTGITIPTGQMIVYAKKVSTQNPLVPKLQLGNEREIAKR